MEFSPIIPLIVVVKIKSRSYIHRLLWAFEMKSRKDKEFYVPRSQYARWCWSTNRFPKSGHCLCAESKRKLLEKIIRSPFPCRQKKEPCLAFQYRKWWSNNHFLVSLCDLWMTTWWWYFRDSRRGSHSKYWSFLNLVTRYIIVSTYSYGYWGHLLRDVPACESLAKVNWSMWFRTQGSSKSDCVAASKPFIFSTEASPTVLRPCMKLSRK